MLPSLPLDILNIIFLFLNIIDFCNLYKIHHHYFYNIWLKSSVWSTLFLDYMNYQSIVLKIEPPFNQNFFYRTIEADLNEKYFHRNYVVAMKCVIILKQNMFEKTFTEHISKVQFRMSHLENDGPIWIRSSYTCTKKCDEKPDLHWHEELSGRYIFIETKNKRCTMSRLEIHLIKFFPISAYHDIVCNIYYDKYHNQYGLVQFSWDPTDSSDRVYTLPNIHKHWCCIM